MPWDPSTSGLKKKKRHKERERERESVCVYARRAGEAAAAV